MAKLDINILQQEKFTNLIGIIKDGKGLHLDILIFCCGYYVFKPYVEVPSCKPVTQVAAVIICFGGIRLNIPFTELFSQNLLILCQQFLQKVRLSSTLW